jgi:hypothetical protein
MLQAPLLLSCGLKSYLKYIGYCAYVSTDDKRSFSSILFCQQGCADKFTDSLAIYFGYDENKICVTLFVMVGLCHSMK